MTKKPEDARRTLADIDAANERARAAIRRSQDLTWTDPEFQRWERGQIECLDEPHPVDRIVFGEEGLVFHQAQPGPLHQRREASNHRRLMFQLCEDGAGSAGGGERFRAEDYPPAPEDITWSGPLMLGPEPDDGATKRILGLPGEYEDQEAETFGAAMQRLGYSVREAARNMLEHVALYGNAYEVRESFRELEVDATLVQGVSASFTLTFQTARPSPPAEPTGLTVRELQRHLAAAGYVNPSLNGPPPGLSVLLGPERAAQLREHLRNQTPIINRVRGNQSVGYILDETSPRVRALMARQTQPAWAVFTHQPQSSPRGNHRQHQAARRPHRPARAPRRTGRRA